MIVGILGILKAGGAYVPIDAASSAGARRLRPRETAGIPAVADGIDAAAKPARGSPASRRSASIRSTGCRPGHRFATWHRRARTPRLRDLHERFDGQPKGVCIEHRNIVNYVLGVSERFELRGGNAARDGLDRRRRSWQHGDLPVARDRWLPACISQERAESQAPAPEYFHASGSTC